MADEPTFPARVVLTFHRRCGARIESDAWCDKCQTTAGHEERVAVEYVRAVTPASP